MINKILNYILAGVIILVLIFTGIFYFKGKKYQKEAREAIAERDLCLNAPQVIIYKDTTIYTHDTIRPKPYAKPVETKQPAIVTVSTTDTTRFPVAREACEEQFYDSVYVHEKFRLHWQASTKGHIQWIRFPDYTYQKELVIKTIDTCIMKTPDKLPLSHLWMYIRPGMMIDPFKVVNATVGLQYTRKDKWGLGAGVGYDWNIQSFVAEGTFLINIK